MKLVMVLVAGLTACTADAPPEDTRCHCTPRPSTLDVLPQLRRHIDMVARQAKGRDVKLVDDELRLQAAQACAPCGSWVGERASVDEMFPLARVRDAVRSTCLGLVLRDGSTVYGDARPAACRR